MRKKDFYAAKVVATDLLCKRADAGLPEVLYFLDMDSGEILDYQEATKEAPDTIDADPDAIKGYDKICVLHSHDVHTPPSAEDWEQMLVHHAIQEVITVTSKAIYTMEKPQNYELLSPFGKAKPSLVYHWKVRRLMDMEGFKGKKPTQIPLTQMQSIWEKVNDEMAIDFGLNLNREQRL